MPSSIQTITDVRQCAVFFTSYFAKGDIFLKTTNGNFRIVYVGYSSDQVALKIPLIKKMPQQCIIFCRLPGQTIYAQLEFDSSKTEDIYLFHVLKMQVITAGRSEERVAVQSSKNLIFVTKIISDFIIEKTLAFETRKCELIKLALFNQLGQSVQHKKYYLINEGMSDPRMRYFYDRKPAYSISDFRSIDKHDPFSKFYIDEIYSKDYYLINRKQFISEAAAPILYKGSIPFAYLQVNHLVPFGPEIGDILDRLSKLASKMYSQQAVFHTLDENLLVSDLSKSGVGIVFKDRTYIRYFQEKSFIHFEILLPDQLRVPVFAIVRNIGFLENKIIKIGCEILEIEPNARVVYDHYVNELSDQSNA